MDAKEVKGSEAIGSDHSVELSYHQPHHPEAQDLAERWRGFLKPQLQVQLEDNAWKEGACFPEKSRSSDRQKE